MTNEALAKSNRAAGEFPRGLYDPVTGYAIRILRI